MNAAEHEKVSKARAHIARFGPWHSSDATASAWASIAALDELLAQPVEQTIPVSRELVAFINGEGPLDGLWFGDPHPTERGTYWWRKRMPSAASPQPPKQGDAK